MKEYKNSGMSYTVCDILYVDQSLIVRLEIMIAKTPDLDIEIREDKNLR